MILKNKKKIKIMKTIKTILTIAALFIITIGFAKTTNSINDFTKCKITKVDDIIVNKNIKAMWKLNYSEEEVPITVIKEQTINGVEYIVHSKYFDVTYASTNYGFGTIETRRSSTIVPKKITNAIINKKEWKKQHILTPNKIDDETAIGLISKFLPVLINNNYNHILN